jgi:hypothetical protein
MPTPYHRYPTPIGTVRERLLSQCRQEDRGFDTPCLIWYGRDKDKDGYGRIKDGGKYVPTHWVLLDKRPPKGYDVDHRCHQRDCVRPSHLEIVTRSENTKRRQSSGTRRVDPAARLVAAEMLQRGDTVAKVADVTGLSRRTVGRITATI